MGPLETAAAKRWSGARRARRRVLGEAGGTGGARGACEVWGEVGAELIAGIHHTFNNRLGTLSAVMQVLETEVDAANPLHGAIGDELERLERTVAMLGSLRHLASHEPEPVQVEDLLTRLSALYEQHHGVRDVPLRIVGAERALPLWAAPSAIGPGLMMLLIGAGVAAREVGRGAVDVDVAGDERFVELSVTPAATAELITAARDATAGLDASIEATGEGVTLRAPTLPEVRRREREAAGQSPA